jgi:hypothetical protein
LIVAHDLLKRAFDLLLDPLDRCAPTAGLWAVSALSGFAVLFVFRWASNPAGIRAARRRAQAELLAVRLYRDDPRIVLRAQARFLVALARYLGHMVLPFGVLLLPLALIGAQLDARYATRALQPEERAVVEAFGTSGMLDSGELQSADGIIVEAGPVRVPDRGEMSWRVAAKVPGRQLLTLLVAGGRVDKEVVVSSTPRGAPARRMSATLSSVFLAPAEAAIEDGLGVNRIAIGYPPLEIDFLGWKVGWITVFLVVSSTVALALRRRMGVEL